MRKKLLPVAIVLILLAVTLIPCRAGAAVATDLSSFLKALADGESLITVGGRIVSDVPIVLGDLRIEGTAFNSALVAPAIIIAGDTTLVSLAVESQGADSYAAAVTVRDGASLSMREVTVLADASSACMHGIYVGDGAYAELTDCDITASGMGHALYAADGTDVRGGALQGGFDADDSGAGLYAEQDAVVSMTDVGIMAGDSGSAAVIANAATVSLNGCVVTGMPALRLGAAAYVSVAGCALYSPGSPLFVEAGACAAFTERMSGASYPADQPFWQGEGTLYGVARDLAPLASVNVEVGKSVALGNVFSPSDAVYFAPITWHSEDPTIAEVNEPATVYGKTTGTTRITATLYNGVTRSFTVTVGARSTVVDDLFDPNSIWGDHFTYGAATPADVIVTSEEGVELPEIPAYVYLAGSDTNIYALASEDSAFLAHCEPGSLLMAQACCEDWLAVRADGVVGYTPAAGAVERAWSGTDIGYPAYVLRDAQAVAPLMEEDVVLSAGQILRTLVTVEDVTAALYEGEVVFLSSDLLKLIAISPAMGTVRSGEWAKLYAAPDEAGEILANIADDVRVELGGADVPEGWVYVRIGRAVGYMRSDVIVPDEQMDGEGFAEQQGQMS